MRIYVVGTGTELNAKFEDLDRNFADPAFIRMTVIDPTGAVIDLSHLVKRRAIGDYFILFIPTTAGYHQYRFAGYGDSVNGGAANEGEFYAQTSFAYATVLFPLTGAIEVDGQDAQIVPTLSVFITPNAGAINVYGQQPGLGNPVIVPDAGSIGFASDAPSLSVVAGLQPFTAQIALVGAQPKQGIGTLTQAGALGFTGIAPVLSTITVLTPATGAINVTGALPNLNGKVQITPNAGSIAFATAAPQQGALVLTQAGSIALSGAAPQLNFNFLLVPTVGSITVNGIAGTRNTNLTLSPSAGALAFTGTQPSFAFDSPRNPNAGVILLAGNAPVVNFTQSIAPNVGAIVVAGNAPLIGVSRQPVAGALAFSGVAGTVIRGTVITPNAGSITINGTTVAIFKGFTLTPSVGGLTLTGFAPGGSAGPLATDDFNRADNASLGTNWTASVSQFGIFSNNALPADRNADVLEFYNAVVWPAKQYSKAILPATLAFGGVGVGCGVACLVNTGGANTGYRLVANLAGYELLRFNAGTPTTIDSNSVPTTWADGDEVYLSVDGNTGAWVIKKNGVLVNSGTDASHLTSGAAGIAYSSTASSANTVGLDNWEGGAI